MYMLRFDIVRCVVLLFYVLMKHFYMREYRDAIKLPESYPLPRGGQGLQIK